MAKKTLLLLSLLIAFSFASCKDKESKKTEIETETTVDSTQVTQQKFPVITFDESEYDFGTIIQGTAVEKIFTFTNTGEAPLVITDVKSSCGCTIPSKPEEPVAPGEKGEIKVQYNGSGAGQVTKVVTITANTENGTETLKIKGIVEKPAE